ncbi:MULTISPECIES: hypothetical protein [Pseudomonas]|jgi:hypothetical protein|uniref:Uncharacterized protein n=1 Tax=Pseudomonas fluorescens TaxID=294 RepID=A0A109L062_PSEFL|nr:MULTISPECIES: hypothetical protein [Pseudomonas]KWV78619.1 hypothetical protein PFL603g_01776 [Pseudomonas fluorescens]MBA1297780.1 hypothetical protein [Pseudomonas carnis]MDH0796245.1 hypothetical protein [Pseudomonas carnis]QHA99110.1 hypothetical protein FXO12_21055 [Pseudomonas sp. J380]
MATKTPAKDKAAPSASVDDQGSVNDSQQDAALPVDPAVSTSAVEPTLHQADSVLPSTDDQGLVNELLHGDVVPETPAASALAPDSTLNQDDSALASLLSQEQGQNIAPGALLQPPLEEVVQLSRYNVTDVSSVLHNGKWYHAGDGISLGETEAVPLLQRLIIEPIQEFNQ